MGLKPWEFWDRLNLRDFFMMQLGYDHHMKELQGMSEMVTSAIRTHAVISFNSNVSKKAQVIREPKQLFRLPSEDEPQKEEISMEEKKEMERKAWALASKIGTDQETPVKSRKDLGKDNS